MASEPDTDDPGLWPIDRVVDELCRNPMPLWSAGAQPQLIPDRHLLEEKLRCNHIDGDNLLALDERALKEDLGMTSFGQRRRVMKAIKYLRDHSQSYQQTPSAADSIERMQSTAYATPQITGSRFSHVGQSPTRVAGIGLHSMEPQLLAYSPSIHLWRDQLVTNTPPVVPSGANRPDSEFERGPPTRANDWERPLLEKRTTQDMANPKAPEGIGGQGPPAIEADETTRQGALNESTIPAPEIEAGLLGQPGSTIPSLPAKMAVISPQMPVPTPVQAKRRIAPTPVPSVSPGSEPLGDCYLSPAVMTLQDMFSYLPSDHHSTFALSPSMYPCGQRRAVAKFMKHFLLQEPQSLPHSRVQIKIPYVGTRLHPPRSEHFFTIFSPRLEPSVQRVKDWPALKTALGKRRRQLRSRFIPELQFEPSHAVVSDSRSTEVLLESDLGDLAYLLHKYPVDDTDEGFPTYGDSGDENDYDDKTWNEMEIERLDSEGATAVMTRSEVEATVDAAVAELKHEWRETKFAKVQLKAYHLWMKAAREKRRQPELDNAVFWRARFNTMMIKIKDAIMKDVWHKASDVKAQCQSIEESVCQFEEYDYRVKALSEEHPPDRPERAALRVKPTRPPELPDGEELLESESEVTSEDDDFVEDDSFDCGSIPYDATDEEWNHPITPRANGKEQIETPPPSTPLDHEKFHHGSEGPRRGESVGMTDDEADAESDTSEERIISSVDRRRRSAKHAGPSTRTSPQPVMPLPPEPSADLAVTNPGEDDSNPDPAGSPWVPKRRYHSQDRSPQQIIDLTFSSSPSELGERRSEGHNTDFEVHTPELNPVADDIVPATEDKIPAFTGTLAPAVAKSSPSAVHSSPQNAKTSGLPDYKNVGGMLRTPWVDIEEVTDRPRALAKALYHCNSAEVKELQDFVGTISSDEQEDILTYGLLALDNDDGHIEGVKAKYQLSAHLLVRCFMTYVCCRDLVNEGQMVEADKNDSFEEIYRTSSPFYKLLPKLLVAFMDHEGGPVTPTPQSRKRKWTPELAAVELADKEDLNMQEGRVDPMGRRPSSRRKRKRKVHQSQEALAQQHSDRQRIQEQERRKAAMEQRFVAVEVVNGDAGRPVNFNEPIVYLDPYIGRRIKAHQLDGVQFMWREIIEDPKHQGCILAHTMGLGKTMQVISLLVTIAQCSRSDDPDARAHVPAHLQQSKTLILCPASLLDNWYDELLMWIPNHHILGDIRKIASKKDNDHVTSWARDGGILLMSYEKFRLLLSASEEKNIYERLLLDEPNLIVADEAHRMKNVSSALSQMAKRFKSLSRIALTGSPLNNHLEEYHTMVDWIAPGYLGDIVQFRSKYSEPINEGLYADSKASERRLCLRKLHVLKRDLDPKIKRADISAIAKDMPSKTEYFITIPLTSLQKEAYDIYVQCLLETHRAAGRTQNARLWDWLAILSLLCNHPSCFVHKLESRTEKALSELPNGNISGPDADGSTPDTGDDSDVNEMPNDVALYAADPLVEAMERAMKVFEEVKVSHHLDDVGLSYRSLIVQQILQQANRQGDKTLIFSHSIPTLNYLEGMLKSMQCQYCRIDGSTNVAKRQNATKAFNDRQSSFQVFLISMRAGGLGLNLQGANRVIIYDFGFNPSWEEQAVGRAYRLGQTRPVFVYRFRTGGTFEEVIYNKAVFKTQLFQRVVDKKNPMRHASKSVTDYFFPAREVPQREFGDCRGKDPKVLDLIMDGLDCIRNIELTETFQKEDDEVLTEEDFKVAEEEYKDQRLQRENPGAWIAKQRAQEEEARAKAESMSTSGSIYFNRPQRPMPAGTVPSFGATMAGSSRPGRSETCSPSRPLPLSPAEQMRFGQDAFIPVTPEMQQASNVATPYVPVDTRLRRSSPNRPMSNDDLIQDVPERRRPRRAEGFEPTGPVPPVNRSWEPVDKNQDHGPPGCNPQ